MSSCPVIAGNAEPRAIVWAEPAAPIAKLIVSGPALALARAMALRRVQPAAGQAPAPSAPGSPTSVAAPATGAGMSVVASAARASRASRRVARARRRGGQDTQASVGRHRGGKKRTATRGRGSWIVAVQQTANGPYEVA